MTFKHTVWFITNKSKLVSFFFIPIGYTYTFGEFVNKQIWYFQSKFLKTLKNAWMVIQDNV